MFLATHLLRKGERRAAMDACPCCEAASLNWNIALNLIRDDFLEIFDLFTKSHYLHEGLCAVADGAFLIGRAASNIRESKAAALYASRRQPLGWLDRPQPAVGSDDDTRLRHALEEMPLHAAAADLNDSMNQIANAVSRLAWEVNIPELELKTLHLDGTPTTARRWISWDHLARTFKKADPATRVFPHFELAKAFANCVDDPMFEFEYRHSRTHRAVPATFEVPYLPRAMTKSPSLRMPREIRTDPLPPLEPTRQRLAGTARLCTELMSELLDFLPRFGEHIGLPIEISGHKIALKLQGNRSRIALPPQILFGPGGSVLSARNPETIESAVIPREKRSPTPFLK